MFRDVRAAVPSSGLFMMAQYQDLSWVTIAPYALGCFSLRGGLDVGGTLKKESQMVSDGGVLKNVCRELLQALALVVEAWYSRRGRWG